MGMFFAGYLAFTATAATSPWWVPWAMKRRGKYSACSKIAGLVIDLLRQPGWDDRYPIEHQCGVKVHRDGRVYLPNGSSAGLNEYWREKVEAAYDERENLAESVKRELGKIQFAENVVAFSEKVRAIR